MKPVFKIQDKVGDIVTQFPAAAEIFRESRIDFCCSGNKTLAETAKQVNINEDLIVGQLNDAYDQMLQRNEHKTDWEKMPFGDFIDYIINNHHAYLNKTLPFLSEYVTKIFRVHGLHHPELAEVHKLFHQLKAELEQHLIKEEEQSFTLIKAYGQEPSNEHLQQAASTIQRLEDEHEAAGDLLKALRTITDDYKLPEDACHSYMLTFQTLQEMEKDTFEHIHLENNILFPRLLNLVS